MTNRCVLTADLDIRFNKYLFVYLKLCLGSADDQWIVQHCVRVIPPVVQVKVATDCTFICVSVGTNTCHTFLFNTSQPNHKLCAMLYITCNTHLPLSNPPLPSSHQSPSPLQSDPTTPTSPKLRHCSGRWPSPSTFWHCWVWQISVTADRLYWLHLVSDCLLYRCYKTL
jgi:hypothetical protein